MRFRKALALLVVCLLSSCESVEVKNPGGKVKRPIALKCPAPPVPSKCGKIVDVPFELKDGDGALLHCIDVDGHGTTEKLRELDARQACNDYLSDRMKTNPDGTKQGDWLLTRKLCDTCPVLSEGCEFRGYFADTVMTLAGPATGTTATYHCCSPPANGNRWKLTYACAPCVGVDDKGIEVCPETK